MRRVALRIDEAGRAWRGDEPIALRPKARLLLRVLAERPGQIVGQDTLIDRVWGHAHIEPRAVFQLVSEIRSALGDRDCIVTYPNRGYAWHPTSVPKKPVKRSWPALTLAASLVVLVTAVLVGSRSTNPEPTAAPSGSALSAFGHGLIERAAGRVDDAMASLRLAVAEHPHFGLAKLELARTLLLTGELEAARSFAHDALSDARIENDPWLEASAQLLLSRVDWLAGDVLGARTNGRFATETALRGGLACVARYSEDWNRLLGRPEPLVDPAVEPLATRMATRMAEDQGEELTRCRLEQREDRDLDRAESKLFEGLRTSSDRAA